MAALPLRVGLIGCNRRAHACLCHAPLFIGSFSIVALADLFAPAAMRLGTTHGLRSMGVIAMLLDPSVDAVLSLTAPAECLLVARAAVAAGKHVYAEAPLGFDRGDASALLARADAAGLRIVTGPGGAPGRVRGRVARPEPGREPGRGALATCLGLAELCRAVASDGSRA